MRMSASGENRKQKSGESIMESDLDEERWLSD